VICTDQVGDKQQKKMEQLKQRMTELKNNENFEDEVKKIHATVRMLIYIISLHRMY